MNQDPVERAADILFPPGHRTKNVKFSGGRCVTAQALAMQIIRADEQIRSGRAQIVNDID